MTVGTHEQIQSIEVEKFKSTPNNPKNRPELSRSGSRDNVRRIVEKEGKTARNLVAWSVPTTEHGNKRRGRSRRKHGKNENQAETDRGRPKSNNHKQSSWQMAIDGERQDIISRHNKSSIEQASAKKSSSKENGNDLPDRTIINKRESKSSEYKERVRQVIEKSSENTHTGQNLGTDNSIQSQKNLRARYWSYLLDHFHRAVDEIYNTCENDENILECKEFIMMIDVCRRDFQLLIQRLELFNRLETSETRPQALAWEVRKQIKSPGKCSPTMHRSPSPATIKYIGQSRSWADCVRGNPSSTQEPSIEVNTDKKLISYPSPVFEASTEEANGEGWEVVRKGRSRSKTSSIVSSTSSTHSLFPLNKTSSTFMTNTTNSIADIHSPSYKILTNNHKTHDYLGEKKTVDESCYKYSPYSAVFFDESSVKVNYYNGDRKQLSYELTDDDLNTQIKQEREKALACAIAEEETLTKELEDEALKYDDQDDDISSDRDYATTDDGRETPKDLSDEIPLDSSMSYSEKPLTWEDICQQYDKEHDDRSFNWADIMDVTDCARVPGRALAMHQKLSSPSRRQSRSDSVKRSQERMARAERRRLRLLVEKCQRLRKLSERVRKVRTLKNRLIVDKERTMTEQMKKAELNRMIVLQEKIKKAQEEEAKVNEIAFINSLEAQNKKIEVQEKHQVSEARLQDLLEERQRRRYDKLAKEEAAQERRRALEEERLARLQEIKQKRGHQAEKWHRERIEKEKLREETAKERQKERKMKVAARNEALQQASEELQKRIEQKHIDSTKRHEHWIEDIKERAASSSRHGIVEDAPSAIPYSKMKICTLCDVEITSDVYMVSHLKGKTHRAAVREVNKRITDAEMEAFSSRYIKDTEVNQKKKLKETNEHAKAMKKRAKKIKARMALKGKEYEASYSGNTKGIDSEKRGRLQKSIKEINKVLQSHGNGPWPKNKAALLDKSLSEITRSLEGSSTNDQVVFCHLGGLAVVSRVLLLWDTTLNDDKKNVPISTKVIKHAMETIKAACVHCPKNCLYMLLGNKLSILVDLFSSRLNLLDHVENEDSAMDKLSMLQSDDGLTITIMECMTTIVESFCPSWSFSKDNKLADVHQRVTDLISYIVCHGVLERLSSVLVSVPQSLAEFSDVIKSVLCFFKPIAFSVTSLDQIFTPKKEEYSFIPYTVQKTDALGLVGFMYLLLHQGTTSRISPSPLPLSENSVALLTAAFKSLNALTLVDIKKFQGTVSKEGISLQYRSVVSYLLRYTSNEKCDELLHEVILSVGYFSVLNEDNQTFLQSGRAPSLVQQLCTLPFPYFSDPRLKTILFPSLISICYKNNENTCVISQDVSPTLLTIFLQEKIDDEQDEKTFPVTDMHQRSILNLRFPRNLWEDAKLYFTEQNND